MRGTHSVGKRREEIERLLHSDPNISVAKIGEHFQVSLVTIRKDLRAMEKEGLLSRSGGKVKIAAGDGPVYNIRQEIALHFDYKERIALKAASMVEEGDIVMLGPGSTCCMIAQLLSSRRVTIVTNAVSFESQLPSNNARVLYLGGEYVPHNGSVMGAFALDALQSLNIDKFFLGTAGVTPTLEITSYDFLDHLMLRTMMERSRETFLVADHTKYGKTGAIKIADMRQMHSVITNRELSGEYCKKLEQRGVPYILV